jgi:tetratricopeptide (TPR) repeat protein
MTGKGIPGEITLLIENIDAIRKIRAYDIEELLREVCSKSFDYMYMIEPDSAAELVERALENFPDLMEDALEVAKKDKYEDRKVLVLAVIVKILLDQGIALYIEGRLNDAIKRLKDAERICKDLKNKELFSNLARTFKTLGENLLAEDRPDDAIKRLKDAERIYIRYLPNDERSSRDVVEILNGLGGAFYMKERFNSSMNKLKSALEILEPLSDKPWYRDLLLETHIRIALVLLRKRNKRDAARHLCRALEMLTDKKAFENLISKKPLKTYISLLRNIPEELIPEECRENLRFYIE